MDSNRGTQYLFPHLLIPGAPGLPTTPYHHKPTDGQERKGRRLGHHSGNVGVSEPELENLARTTGFKPEFSPLTQSVANPWNKRDGILEAT